MPSPARIYQAEMHGNLGFFATWLPGDLIEIGEIGVLVDGRFRRMSSLKDLGIRCTSVQAGSPQNVQYTSTKGTQVSTGSEAAAKGVAGSIAIDFSADGAFLFHAYRLRASRISNLPVIGTQILELHESGHWDRDWYLIESVHAADRATIIVSQDTSAGRGITPLSASLPLPGNSPGRER